LLIAGLIAAASTAEGKPSAVMVAKADAHKQRAFELLGKSQYAAGVAELEKGYAAVPHPDFLFNIAIAYERWAGHCMASIEAYRRYLDACGQCRGDARGRLARVQEGCAEAVEPAPRARRVVVLVREAYESRAGAAESPPPKLRAQIHAAAKARGFDVVASDRLAALHADEAAVIASIAGSPKKAAEIAMKYDADLIISATASVEYTSFDDLGMSEYHARGSVTLEAVDAATALVVATASQDGPSPPSCFDEASLYPKTVAHLMKRTMAPFMEKLDADADGPTRFTVRVLEVPSFREHGRAMIQLISVIPGVADVRKLSFGGGRMELEVTAKISIAQLESAILDAAASDPALKTLDVAYARGRELALSL